MKKFIIYKMEVINSNYSSQFTCDCESLSELHTLLPDSKLYTGRPTMIKMKNYGVTVLIFSNFTCRLMGGGSSHAYVFQKFLESVANSLQVKPLTLMSHTMTNYFNFKINLHQLPASKFLVNIELFPAAKYIHYGSMHANIFQTGVVIITGVRVISDAKLLIDQIEIDLKNSPKACYDFESAN
jgi:hypothetical protein